MKYSFALIPYVRAANLAIWADALTRAMSAERIAAMRTDAYRMGLRQGVRTELPSPMLAARRERHCH